MRSTITEAQGVVLPDHRSRTFRRQRAERGAASMEALLCLPFVFLVFALILNLGYGWVMRMKADAAARFAGTYHVHLPVESWAFGDVPEPMRELVQQKYFPHSDPIKLEIYLSPVDVSDLRDAGRPIEDAASLDRMLTAMRLILSGRNKVFLRVPRRVPTGTLLPSTPIDVTFAIDGNTWTHQDLPMGIDALTDGPVGAGLPPPLAEALRVVGYVLKGFFWLLGMTS